MSPRSDMILRTDGGLTSRISERLCHKHMDQILDHCPSSDVDEDVAVSGIVNTATDSPLLAELAY